MLLVFFALFLASGPTLYAAWLFRQYEVAEMQIGVLASLATLALAAAWVGGELFISRPVDELLKATRRLGAGDLSVRIGHLAGPKELRQIAHAFDQMVVAIEQREAERAQAPQFLEALINNTPAVAVRIYDREGRVQRWNPASEAMYGFPAEEVLGRRLQDVILTPDEAPAFEADLARIWETRQATPPYEWTVRHKDGSLRHVYSTMFPVVCDGECVAVCCMDVDITERWRAEEEVRLLQTITAAIGEAEDLDSALGAVLRKVCDATGWILGEAWIPRPDGSCVERSPAWYSRSPGLEEFSQASTGFTFAPEVGLPGRVWASKKPAWIRDVREDPNFLRAALARRFGLKAALGVPVLAGDEVVAVICFFVFEQRQEDERLARLIVAVAAQLGSTIERKRTEERLRLQSAALEAAANAIAITDRQGRISWVNPAFTRLTGYSLEEVIGQNPRLLKSGQQDQAFYQQLWQTILAGKVWQGELVNRRKNGSLYIDEQIIAPVRDRQGEISHFIAVKQDISRRKRRERELEAIASVTAALRTASTRAEMLLAILDQLLDLLQAEGTALAMRDPATGEAVIERAHGRWAHWTGVRLPPGEGVSGQVIATGRPHVSDDAQSDPLLIRSDLIGDLRAVACIPLIAHGETIGVLWAGRQRAITTDELRLLTTIADIAANAIRRAMLHEQTERHLQRLAALHAIDITFTASLDLSVTLGVLLDQVIGRLDVSAADVLLLNPHTQALAYATGRGFRSGAVARRRLRLGEGHAGRAALERRIVQIPDLSATGGAFLQADLLAGEGFIAYYAVPLVARGRVMGVLELFHREPPTPDVEWLSFLEMLAASAAIAIDKATLFNELQRSNTELVLAYDTTLEGWSRALELRDQETEGHTRRVAELAVRLAQAMGMDKAELVHVWRGALLHDIGKMGIPDSILLKSGPLTDEEWAIMRQHPVYAYGLLAPIAYLRPALDIPYCHHEKWDGTGYPRGLKGEEIPLAARIFAVVDVWDALRSDRPYRPAWPEAQAREHIRQQAGRHFDPQVVEAFLRIEP